MAVEEADFFTMQEPIVRKERAKLYRISTLV
jgi:hypothetical protein